MTDRELVLRGAHVLLAHLHLMLAGVKDWDPWTIDTAEMLIGWWEKQR